MTLLHTTPSTIKSDDVSPPSNIHGPAPVIPFPVARPNRRESLFALQIWNVERKPAFTRSRIYGFAR